MEAEQELKVMKLEAELASVDAGKKDMLCRIKEREMDLDRMRTSVAAQDKRIAELTSAIEKMRGGN